MRVGYWDCFAGISGDMSLGALVDCGADLTRIQTALEPMQIPGLGLGQEKVLSHGISATRVTVTVEESPHHRTLAQVMEVVAKANLSETVLTHAEGAFRALAESEGRVHGKDPDKIHFHEVGANDAIVDVVGVCLGIEELGIERLACSRVVTGGGTLRCAHGQLPIPGPAAAQILEGFEIEGGGVDMELATPTGAALLKEFCGTSRAMPPLRILRSGYGAGTREIPGRANVVRLTLGDAGGNLAAAWHGGAESSNGDEVAVLECDIDDMPPEIYGVLRDDLFRQGALDVTLTPVQMKKGRPGTHVSVLAPLEEETLLARTLMAGSTTIGVRVSRASRYKLHREAVTVETPWGAVAGKMVWGHGVAPRWSLEFEEARRIHDEHGVPMRDIYRIASESARTAESNFDASRSTGQSSPGGRAR